MNNDYKGEIIIYQIEDGLSKIDVKVENEAVWLSLDQMADLFQRNKSTISRYIRNIFSDGELSKDSVVANIATTVAEVDYVLDTLGDRELPKEFGVLKEGGKLVSLRGMPNGEYAVRAGLPAIKRFLLKVARKKYDKMASKKVLTITDAAMEKLKASYDEVCGEDDYGNGRYVRKMLEEAEMNLAGRLFGVGSAMPNEDELTVIDLCDIPESSHLKKEVKRSIGFAS